MKFLNFLVSAFREDGDNSPLSSRRIALAFIIWFAYMALKDGIPAAFAAGSAGAPALVVAVFLAPFIVCIIAIIAIVIRLTATDVAQIVDAAKGK